MSRGKKSHVLWHQSRTGTDRGILTLCPVIRILGTSLFPYCLYPLVNLQFSSVIETSRVFPSNLWSCANIFNYGRLSKQPFWSVWSHSFAVLIHKHRSTPLVLTLHRRLSLDHKEMGQIVLRSTTRIKGKQRAVDERKPEFTVPFSLISSPLHETSSRSDIASHRGPSFSARGFEATFSNWYMKTTV